MKPSKAFTLVELLIASSIFLVVAVTIYSAFGAGIFGFRDIQENIDIQQAARQVLGRIDIDLRNSFVYSMNETKFTGNENEISFLTLVDTFSKDKIVQEYAFVSYAVSQNTLMRLCRRGQESLNVNSEISPEEIAANISQIAFSYGYIDPADGSLRFQDSWGSPSASSEQKVLPVAVKIAVSIKDKTEQTFERIIYLPLAK